MFSELVRCSCALFSVRRSCSLFLLCVMCDLSLLLFVVMRVARVPIMCSRDCSRYYPLLFVVSIVPVLVLFIIARVRVLCSCSFFVFCVRVLVLRSAALSVVLGCVMCSCSWY